MPDVVQAQPDLAANPVGGHSRGTRWFARRRYLLLLVLGLGATVPLAWLMREARIRQTPQSAAGAFLHRSTNGQTWLALGLASPESTLWRQSADVEFLKGVLLTPEELYADQETAVVFSSSLRDNRGRQGQLAVEMTAARRGWWITDVDFVQRTDKARWLQDFTRRRPQATEQRVAP